MVRVILYNVEYLMGTTGKKWEYLLFWRRFFGRKKIGAKICKELSRYNPDIVAFNEIDGLSHFGKNYVELFKQGLGMKYSVEKIKYRFKGKYEILKYLPFWRNQANAILSKNKFHHHGFFYFNEGVKRAIIKVSLNLPNKVTLFLVHLSLGKDEREKQLKELGVLVKKSHGPVVVMGDFNTFKGESEIKDLLKSTGLKHKFKLRETKNVFTFPSFRPKKRFDYVLTSPEINVKKYDVLKLLFSDHLPVMVDFEVKGKEEKT